MDVISFISNNPLTATAFGLGVFIMAAGAIAVVLTVTGIVISLIFLKTRQIVIPSVTLFILNTLEVPIRYLLWFFGIEEDIVSNLIIEVRNILYREKYDSVPYAQRAIFIPQCLRSPQCPAPLTPEGIKCLDCGRCGLGKVKQEAESLGYLFFIAPGSSLIKRMVKKYRPMAILGVGCCIEVKEGTAKMAAYGLPVQGVLLERDGCVDTRVSTARLLEKIRTLQQKRGKYHIDSDPEGLKKAVEIYEMWGSEPRNVEVLAPLKKPLRPQKP
jgi:hypothetical protein